MFAHGSFTSASCITCLKQIDLDEVKAKVMRAETPRCPCGSKSLVKPDIVFFGEMLPER